MHWNVSAQFEVTFIVRIVQATPYFVQLLEFRIVSVLIGRLHSPSVEIAPNRSEKPSSAGLRNQLYDATSYLAILGFKSSRLNLHFFHERQVDAGTKRTIYTRPNADAAKCRIIDRNAIRYI